MRPVLRLPRDTGTGDRKQVRGMQGCAQGLAQPPRRVKALAEGCFGEQRVTVLKAGGEGDWRSCSPLPGGKGEPCKHQGCSSESSLALGSTWTKGRIPTGSSCLSSACPCPALLIPGPGERERMGKRTGQKDQTPWGKHQAHPHPIGASPRRKRGMTFLAEHGSPWAHRGRGLSTPQGTQVSSPGGETGEHKEGK